MRTLVAVTALTLFAGWFVPVHAQDTPELQLSFDAAGTVNLRAHRVTVRQIIAEWARQCGCHVINAEKLAGAPLPVPVQFEHAAQGDVLESLLRQAAGYALTPKRVGSRSVSEYETIYILATSAPSTTPYVPPAYTPPTPMPPFPTPGAPDDEIPPVTPSAAPRPGQTPDPPAAPAPRPGYAPGMFVPVPIVPIAPITTPTISAPGTVTPMLAARPTEVRFGSKPQGTFGFSLRPSIAISVILLASALLTYYIWNALATDLYRTFIQGIWLTLARDLTEGLFYRPVSEAGVYGGTRYFPLHFVALAAFWRLGAGPIGASFIVQAIAAATLATGLFAAARRLRLRVSDAALVAAAGFVPYFVHQSLQELRCDVLAAGLNVWGLALVLPEVTKRGTPRLATAAFLFTLAFATKVTSVSMPISVVAGLLLVGCGAGAVRVLTGTAAGTVAALLVIHFASSGRALENWKAAMFAGVGADGTLQLFLQGTFLGRLQYSRYLVGLGLLVTVGLTLAFARRHADRSEAAHEMKRVLVLISIVFAVATLALAVTLSSPGAVVANQAVEWIQVAVLVLASAGVASPMLGRMVGGALVALVLWASAQDVSQVRRMLAETSAIERQSERARVLERIRATDGAVFSESALWPALAGRTPIVLDAFMFRVIGAARPDMARDLIRRFDQREFALVLIRYDPEEVLQGHHWFERVALGSDVADGIVRNYRPEGALASDVIAYVPR